ncbi:HupE/UreJ family protein [Pelagibius sp. Alg239-R121]|uniref:HupE/UreJ family protein n=1 Tax=Pelagibius sp. Alg239-R121 TaxID=2993448 RepID=UPI0024A7494B|nr:HupE/UreJ family protein [Pelagibius sp. Alg239-R121]
MVLSRILCSADGWCAWRPTRLTLLFALVAGLAGTAAAHFNLNVNIRIIHVEERADDLRVLIRLPMAYLIADKLGPEQADGSRAPAPYSTNSTEDEVLVHYLDAEALRRDPGGLASLIAEGHIFRSEGRALVPEIGRLRAYPALKQVPFATLEEADTALKGEVYPDDFEATYVGDTIVDVEIIYRAPESLESYTIESTLDPGLPGQEDTANLVLIHGAGDPLIFRVRGLMAEPLEVSRSLFEAFFTFVKEGVRHILEGTDHVLFVFCLVLGATLLKDLLWRITGFTVGHSVTLALGFFGFAPKADWFVPLVETGIALSIVYAAVIAISKQQHAGTIAITSLIGLLHGLGFSFVLREILQLDAPNIWQSLLAFNVGVEVGQVAIALVVWPCLWALAKYLPTRMTLVRGALALPCVAIAAIWIGERSVLFFEAL